MNILGANLNPFSGLRFVASLDMVDYVEDWSRVRSLSRARRRLRQGHRQNIATHAVPKPYAVFDKARGIYYVHPIVMRELRERIPAA